MVCTSADRAILLLQLALLAASKPSLPDIGKKAAGPKSVPSEVDELIAEVAKAFIEKLVHEFVGEPMATVLIIALAIPTGPMGAFFTAGALLRSAAGLSHAAPQ
jgi:hypothetical protein